MVIRQSIRQAFHLRPWKTIKKVVLRKPNTVDYIIVKSHRVISLLNYLGKVCEKVEAEMLPD